MRKVLALLTLTLAVTVPAGAALAVDRKAGPATGAALARALGLN